MAYKAFQLSSGLPVTIYKRKASRSLRLSVSPKGEIRVSIPTWTPYTAGLSFAQSRLSWINSQLPLVPRSLAHGQAIGKAHHLQFVPKASLTKPVSRVQATDIIISYPYHLQVSDPAVQKLAESASIRALRAQAERLLPTRVAGLAERHGFQYQSISVKQLKSRWGSCDSQQNITFNLFLMQLPWECIDYVILHELVHTKVMRHGPDFWRAIGQVLPNSQQLRHSLRTYQPILHIHETAAVA